VVNRVTGANCFHVQGEPEGNRTYFTKGRNEAAVQNMNGEDREVIRYDSNQIKPKTQAQVFEVFL
jgi:hypothetical protein